MIYIEKWGIMREPLEKYKIIIESEDIDLIKPCQKFINDLEQEYILFKSKLEKNEKKWESYLNNENIFFIPEEISIRSPLTIIDAPWGSGKTFLLKV